MAAEAGALSGRRGAAAGRAASSLLLLPSPRVSKPAHLSEEGSEARVGRSLRALAGTGSPGRA